MKLLAVDDDPTILEMLSNCLTARHGFDLVCAVHAEQALALLDDSETDFDCFLLDIMLPGIDGIALYAKLRSLQKHRQTPILMITASTTADLMNRAFEAGATDFIYKPLNGVELGARINTAGLLNDSLRRERVAHHSLAELTDLMKIRPEESFDLGVPDVHDLNGFENRLLRLPEGCYAMNLIAIKLPQVRNIFDTLTPAEFCRQMVRVAEASVEALQDQRCILGYAGNGVMVAAIFARSRIDPLGVQRLVQQNLTQSRQPSDAGGDLAEDVAVKSLTNQRLWTARSACGKVREYVGQNAPREQAATDDGDSFFSFEI
ncbi:MAG: response regulator [Sulfitobacter sp.]|nr:response regulator [Sulfitobacter sp.]